jgi:hypothetical protein
MVELDAGGVVPPDADTGTDALTEDALRLAVRTSVLALVVARTVAVKAALVCPAETVTEAGMLNVTPLPVALSETLVATLAAALKVAVQEVAAGAVSELGEHVKDLTVGGGGVVPPDVPGDSGTEVLTDDPFRLAVTTRVVAVVAEVTLTEKAALVCPAETVTEPGLLNAAPLAVALSETLVAAVAAALKVTVHEVAAGAVSELGEHARDLTVAGGGVVPPDAAGDSGTEVLTDDPFRLAVRTSVLAVVVVVTLTEKVALVCPAETVTEPGLLNVAPLAAAPSETLVAAVGAALNVTVHEVDAGTVSEVGEHASVLRVGVTAGA